MAKAFSENESGLIREKLIENCRICWQRYGYRKTSVSQLASLSGISTGAFYSFFQTKEMLFLTTANEFQQRLYALLSDSRPENPTKLDLAAGFKMIVAELRNNQWYFSLHEDYEVFVRKLPQGFIEEERSKDLIDITNIVELYGVTPKASLAEITAVIYTIVLSLYFTESIGPCHPFALETLIDVAIDKLFE
ncbi:MAG: TetR/AcrR family transcriptional regulator [Eggerthellaceae bacterium]|nr:TetR/AcrR family transcriptional regulator [Eggerthellaceae bacterium]